MDQNDDRKEFTPAEPSTKLFIGGLAWAATDEDLVAAFAPFGELAKDESGRDKANVARYPDTGRSKGFAFVEYVDIEDAKKARDEMDGKDIQGRAVKVDFARPRERRDDRMAA